MYRELINNIPFWGLVFLSIMVCMSVCYLSGQVARYFVSTPVDKEQLRFANSLIGILSGGFSILLAFVIVNSWNYLQSTRESTIKEANYLAVMIRDLAVFPPKIQTSIRAEIANYVISVRTDEWKSMRHGYASPKAWSNLDSLYKVIQRYIPSSPHQQIFYNHLLINLNGLLEARRDRLLRIDSLIPTPLKDALIGGSLVLAIILGAFHPEKKIKAIAPVLLFSGLLGFNLALAVSFDYPFSGNISVSNKAYYWGLLANFKDPG